jgi:hypothetical protein
MITGSNSPECGESKNPTWRRRLGPLPLSLMRKTKGPSSQSMSLSRISVGSPHSPLQSKSHAFIALFALNYSTEGITWRETNKIPPGLHISRALPGVTPKL